MRGVSIPFIARKARNSALTGVRSGSKSLPVQRLHRRAHQPIGSRSGTWVDDASAATAGSRAWSGKALATEPFRPSRIGGLSRVGLRIATDDVRPFLASTKSLLPTFISRRPLRSPQSTIAFHIPLRLATTQFADRGIGPINPPPGSNRSVEPDDRAYPKQPTDPMADFSDPGDSS